MKDEPQVLRQVRNDIGKEMRKDYEAGKIKARRMEMKDYESREDGISNTLTSVQKDNLVMEPKEPKMYQIPHGYMKGNVRDNCPSITKSSWEANNVLIEPKVIEAVGCAQRGREGADGIMRQQMEFGSSVSNTVTTVQKDSLVAEFSDEGPYEDVQGRISQVKGINGYPNLKIKQNTEQGYAEVQPGGIFDSTYPTSKTRRGRVQGDKGSLSPTITSAGEPLNVYEGMSCKSEDSATDNIPESQQQEPVNAYPDGTARTIKAQYNNTSYANFKHQGSFGATGAHCGYRIRKLTPRECYRLMGVNEANIDKIQASGLSKSQQYKTAGNSIVVDCLFHIFRKMFVEKECEEVQLRLF